MKNIIIFLALLAILFQSCFSYQTLSTYQMNTKRGGVDAIEISNPRIYRDFKLLPWVVTVLTFPIAGGIPFICGYFPKQTLEIDRDKDAYKWTKIYGKEKKIEYVAVPSKKTRNKKISSLWEPIPHQVIVKDYQNMVIVKKKEAELNFTAENVKDVEFFAEVFRNSPYIDAFIKRSSVNADEYTLEKLIKTFPFNNEILLAKRRYIQLAANYDDFNFRVITYPNVISKEDEICMASTLIKSLNDLVSFRLLYGSNTAFDNDIYTRLYKILSNGNDLQKLIDYYPEAADSDSAKQKLISIAPDFPALKSILDKYGQKYLDFAEEKGIELIYNDYKQFNIFIQTFPGSKYYLNKNFEYIGYTENGIPSGKGIKKDNTEILIGTFKNGKLNGEKCKIVSTELNYEGQVVDDAPSGYGTGYGTLIEKRYPLREEGVTYTGNWLNGWPSGTGKYSAQNSWIEGTFKRGFAHGYAILRTPQYMRGSGNFNMGTPNGSFLIELFTLGGRILSSSSTVNATSWEDLNVGANNLIKDHRNSNSIKTSAPCYIYEGMEDVFGHPDGLKGYKIVCADKSVNDGNTGYLVIYFDDYWRIDEGIFGSSRITYDNDKTWEEAAEEACKCK